VVAGLGIGLFSLVGWRRTANLLADLL